MKKMNLIAILLPCLFLLNTSVFGGNSAGQVSVEMKSPLKYLEMPVPGQSSVPFEETHLYKKQNMTSSTQIPGDRAVTTVPIGSAGNLYTIINNEVRSVAANNDVNSVVFIHRANPEAFPNDNVGQYRYDVSTDGGQTWTIDQGVVNPSGNNNNLACRYPNAVIHNPVGNTTAANAYMGYKGAWLPFGTGGTWDGTVGGVARLDNNSTSFTETYYGFNNNNVLIATGLSNGVNGVFWAVDYASPDGAQNINGIIVYQGFWNPATNDIDWSVNTIFNPTFYDNSVTALNMAFDPSGQYGWVVVTADITATGRGVLNPVFYRTQDGGNTWSGPIEVYLETIPEIADNLADPLEIPTTGFDNDIAVDINGNPHLSVIVGMGNDYAITTGQGAGLKLYNITYNPSLLQGCKWNAIKIADVETFRGQITSDVSEDNRPQVSRSPDGTKIFFGWTDSDPNITGGTNDLPNLHVRGYNVTTGLFTPIENFTAGDQVWDGGALFPSFAATTLVSGGTYTVPTVFTELNPFTGSDIDPTYFHYVQNIQFSNADFTIDLTPPVIALNGQSPVTVVVGGTYNELGASANDNLDGDITAQIVTAGTVNVNTVGSYTITYNVTDVAGNVACEITRTVNVVASPDNTPPVIQLVGSDTLVADVCDFFVDPGATATDDVDGNITHNIVVTNNIVNGVEGTYTIEYDVTDGAGNAAATVERVVILENTPPTINLIGNASISVEACQGFNDPGVIAFDNCLGVLTPTITSNVDENSPGSYTVTYEVTDGFNPPVQVTRSVTVTADVTAPEITLVGDAVVYVYLGDAYVDEGATADDACDGNLDASVNVDVSDVNTTQRGTYEVVYTVSDAAGNQATETRTVVVNTEPEAQFTYSLQYPGSSVTASFTDQSLYTPSSWLWTFGDGTQNQNQNPTKNYFTSNTYEVCLTATNMFGSSDPECKMINVAVGVEESILSEAFEIYPNPTKGEVFIKVVTSVVETATVAVYDILGKEVVTPSNWNLSGVDGQKYMLDMKGFAEGLYFIKIETEKGSLTHKIVILN